MNLHGIVSAAIGAINPMIPATLQPSAGYTTGPDGTRTPSYDPPINLMVQAQAVTSAELRQLEMLNIQGVTTTVYLSGAAHGIERVNGSGGDLLTFSGQTWLTVAVLERWPDWTKVAVTLQDGS